MANPELDHQEVVTKTRQAFTGAMAELGFPIQIGTVNLDGHVLTEKDITQFNRDFDQTTIEALKTTSNQP